MYTLYIRPWSLTNWLLLRNTFYLTDGIVELINDKYTLVSRKEKSRCRLRLCINEKYELLCFQNKINLYLFNNNRIYI